MSAPTPTYRVYRLYDMLIPTGNAPTKDAINNSGYDETTNKRKKKDGYRERRKHVCKK